MVDPALDRMKVDLIRMNDDIRRLEGEIPQKLEDFRKRLQKEVDDMRKSAEELDKQIKAQEELNKQTQAPQ